MEMRKNKKRHLVTLIPGDGIGPEVTAATVRAIECCGADIRWERVNAGMQVLEAQGELVPDEVYRSLERNRVGLKGPITTPIGKGFRSINVMLRKKYDLYANVRPVLSVPGIESRYKDVDLVIFRENTEGLYIGRECVIKPGHTEAVKLITEEGSERIVRSAFEFAKINGRRRVTAVHKANILKIKDGLFLEVAAKVAREYPTILYDEVIIDNMCMQLVMYPQQYDVIVTMNLYGDILSDLCAGLVGGLGLVPGGNVGKDMAIFEAVHGSAPDIAGKNLANPTAMMLSGAMLLDHLGEQEGALRLRKAIAKTISEGEFLTADVGGSAGTEEFTEAVCRNIEDGN